MKFQNIVPDFEIVYKQDYRQKIADSWPQSINDNYAQNDWNWQSKYDLKKMTEDMIKKLKTKYLNLVKFLILLVFIIHFLEKRNLILLVKTMSECTYVGLTVYGEPHLGHARPAITFDIVFRYLSHCGNKVRYVRNITDAGHLENDSDDGEDKIAKKARAKG